MQQDSTDPTGVRDDSPKGGSEVARARDRKANAALELRKAGASWDEIAEVLGFPTARTALVAVEKALENGLRTKESQEFMRNLAGQRLDRLLRSVWKKAIEPENPEHLVAVTKARELIAQHAKLHGLDAPTEMVVHSPSAPELERWVASVVQAGAPQLEEADIFDAEVVEDEHLLAPKFNPTVQSTEPSED